MKNKTHSLKREKYWMKQYDTINNGLNEYKSYITNQEKTGYKKNYYNNEKWRDI